MLAAKNGEKLSFVDVIVRDSGQRKYVVGVYADEQSRRNANAYVYHNFLGTPNATDILAVLGEGWVAEPDLPLLSTVPSSVTAWQIRRWLVLNGYTMSQIDDIITAIPDAAQREAVRVDWEYAPYVERDHPMLVPMAAELGLSEQQLDDAFRDAEKILSHSN